MLLHGARHSGGVYKKNTCEINKTHKLTWGKKGTGDKKKQTRSLPVYFYDFSLLL